MQRTLVVQAYDLLDHVVVTATLRDWDSTTVPPQSYVEFSTAATVPGTGEDDPQEWVKDALVALIEAL